MTEALARLREAVDNKDKLPPVTPFVGAGFSSAATGGAEHASWRGLLLDGIKVCERICSPMPPGWAERMKEQLDNADSFTYIAAADEITRRLRAVREGREFATWLRRTVGGLQATVEGSEVIEAVCSLGSVVVTTNYDELIEQARPDWRSYTWTDKEYGAALSAPPVVLHLHGVVGKPKSIILSSAHYERLGTKELTQIFNQALFASRQFIFIGCGDGLSDPDISTLMEFVRRVRPKSDTEHYVLVNGKQLRWFNEHPLSPRVTPVAYGHDFDALAPFLRDLAAGNSISVSQDPDDYDRRPPVALLDLARPGWENLQAAEETLRRAERAMDQIDNRGAMPEGMTGWDYRDSADVHEQLAAAIRDPVSRLESGLVQAVASVKEADRVISRLAADQFAGFTAELRRMTRKVDELEAGTKQLRGRVLEARNDLRYREKLCGDYRMHTETMTRAYELIDAAHIMLHSLKGDLSRRQAGQAPQGAPVQPAAQQREEGPAEADPGEAARAGLRVIHGEGSAGPGEDSQPDAVFFPEVITAMSDQATRLQFRGVPVLADVSAGVLKLADPDNVGDHQALPAQHVHGEPVFMLRVDGDSMEGEDGVLDGDYVVVRQQQSWEEGDMVVIFVEGEGATVKRIWRREDGSIVLQPSNPSHAPQILEEGTEPIIEGKVIGVARWHISQGRRPPPG